MDLHVFRARARLLEAARQLFIASPQTSVTVDDICLAAAVSKGGFYHHFPDKEAVFLTIALDELERTVQFMAGVTAEGLQRDPNLRARARGEGPVPSPLEIAERASRPVTLSKARSLAESDSSPADGGLRMTEPRSLAGPDASSLLVDLWALAPRRRAALRQVRAVHRRALRQALQSRLGKPSENSDGGDREAQATTAFLMWVGFLVHRALAREVAIDRRGREKAAG